MAIEALNDAYAKIESIVPRKKRGRSADNVEAEFRISLCGGHLHCMDVAESLMKECVGFLFSSCGALFLSFLSAELLAFPPRRQQRIHL